MLNKDYLRLLLVEKKKLMPISQVRTVNVPKFDELAVQKIFPLKANDPTFMAYFPDKLPQGRWPERRYFFNILNTLEYEYLQHLIAHANRQRHSAEEQGAENANVEATEFMWEELHKLPFISSRSLLFISPLLDCRGRTLHLLKQRAKPVTERKQRRKFDLACLPAQVATNTEDKTGGAADTHMVDQSFRDITGELKRPATMQMRGNKQK